MKIVVQGDLEPVHRFDIVLSPIVRLETHGGIVRDVDDDLRLSMRGRQAEGMVAGSRRDPEDVVVSPGRSGVRNAVHGKFHRRGG